MRPDRHPDPRGGGGWAPPCACFSAESSRAIPPGGRLLRADPLRSNALWNRSSSTGGVVVGRGRLRCTPCRSLHHEHHMLSPILIIHIAFASGNHHAGKEPSATCASFMTLLNYASSLLLIGSRQAGRWMRHAVEGGVGQGGCIVFICCPVLHRIVAMVAIAQLVEHLIVVQKVARSSRVSHPTEDPPSWRVFLFSARRLPSRLVGGVDASFRRRACSRPVSSAVPAARPAGGGAFCGDGSSARPMSRTAKGGLRDGPTRSTAAGRAAGGGCDGRL